jgi:hypothetical protein
MACSATQIPLFTPVAHSRNSNSSSAVFFGKNRFSNGLAAASLRMRPASSRRRGVLRVACEKVFCWSINCRACNITDFVVDLGVNYGLIVVLSLMTSLQIKTGKTL